MKTCLACILAAVSSPLAAAGVAVETYGASAPPSTINGYAMGAAPFDSRLFMDVTSVPLSASLSLTLDRPVSVRQIGAGWVSWSHGYTGNVYYTNGVERITITLPQGTPAFSFYAEPNPFMVFQMTATGSDGFSSLSSSQSADGDGGAVGWGFYGTSGSSVGSVLITCDVDFGFGEFAIAIPSPGGPAVLGLLGLAAARRRR